MGFIGGLKQRKPASQPENVEREGLMAHRLNLADHMRLRQIERMLQQTLEELDRVKARLSQLENSPERHCEPINAADKTNGQRAFVSSAPPLPVDEIKQLAEMAKRFK